MFDDELDKTESALATTKYKGKKKPRGRSCYECGSTEHFIRDCPQSKSEKEKSIKRRTHRHSFHHFWHRAQRKNQIGLSTVAAQRI